MNIWAGDLMKERIESIMKKVWIGLLFLLILFMAYDIFIKFSMFQAEYISKNDYFFIIIFPIIYLFTKKHRIKLAMNISWVGFIVSLINKFGFMLASILMW